jgi:flagellar biosynthesis protein FlhA
MPTLKEVFTAMRQGEVLLAVGVISLIVLFFLPLPPMALDLLFAVNITMGLLILLTVLFIDKALEFTSFPMMLLIATTFRLALNVASTRLILSDGHQTTAAAGKIIETFGSVIMGGSFIIGLIIFLILIIVNFVVITKGSGRIAEVAARFTLDSLPGKQMAIDADLNAGLINEDQARSRRKELEDETGFYGAMDGASKFVRGDAIAGLIITGLNIAVGIIIGTTQHGMTLLEAADRYMLLTVGDGLVAYIPALTISIAAGMLVAKSGTAGGAGKIVFEQLSANDRALFVAASIVFLISLLPNMPILPFWALSGGLGTLGYLAYRQRTAPPEPEITEEEAAAAEAAEAPAEEPIASVLHVDTLRLELGYGLLNLIDESRGGRLTDQIKAMRRQMARDIGFVVPSIRIQDNMQLQPGEYAIFIKDIRAGSGTLEAGRLLAMDATGDSPPIEGEATTEPTFGLPAVWIDESRKEDAQFNGYTVVDNATVIVTHLTEIVKDNLAELLTRAEVEKILEELRGEHGRLIEDLVPEKVSIGVLQKVLQNLLAERVSVRDIPSILETLADHGSVKNINTLTELVRQRLARQISSQHAGPEGTIPIISLSPTWEKEFNESIISQGEERQLAMAPDKVQAFLRSTKDAFEKQMMSGLQPILLTSPSVRPFARTLIERTLPTIAVLSQSELYPRARIKTVGTI